MVKLKGKKIKPRFLSALTRVFNLCSRKLDKHVLNSFFSFFNLVKDSSKKKQSTKIEYFLFVQYYL